MLWYLDRSRLSAAIWANCDAQSDVAHYVHDLDSFYDLCGALLQLGMAGRQSVLSALCVCLMCLPYVSAVSVCRMCLHD